MDSAALVSFWIGLAVTCAWSLGLVLRAVKKPERLTELPLFVGTMWFYFYGFMAVGVGLNLASYLPDWALALGQIVALASFLGLLAGWRQASRRNASASRGRPSWRSDPNRVWWAGLGLMLVGAISLRLLIGGGQVDWEGTSAYWYLSYHVMYPGLALCLMAGAMTRKFRKLYKYAMVTGVALFGLYPHLVGARRGPLFPAVIVLLLVPPLVTGRTPSRAKILGGLAAAGFLMLLFLAARPFVYETANVYDLEGAGERWQGAMKGVTAENIFLTRVRQEGDNEFLYHCGMVATIVQLERYQYGTGYLSLLTHWVPRQWWPNKPRLGEGMFEDAVGRIPDVMGWSLSAGAAAGGVAEVFNQFGFASPLFWALFGYAVGRLYGPAKNGDHRWILAYVGIACATHWLVSQGVAAAFVPACIYVIVPLVVLRFARVRGERMPLERSAKALVA